MIGAARCVHHKHPRLLFLLLLLLLTAGSQASSSEASSSSLVGCYPHPAAKALVDEASHQLRRNLPHEHTLVVRSITPSSPSPLPSGPFCTIEPLHYRLFRSSRAPFAALAALSLRLPSLLPSRRCALSSGILVVVVVAMAVAKLLVVALTGLHAERVQLVVERGLSSRPKPHGLRCVLQVGLQRGLQYNAPRRPIRALNLPGLECDPSDRPIRSLISFSRPAVQCTSSTKQSSRSAVSGVQSI